jgi:hypothetical protein
MNDIEAFSLKIPKLTSRPSRELIPVFGYYFQIILSHKSFSASEVKSCFKKLSLKPYSNVSAFLSANSKGKIPLFLKQKEGYSLTRKTTETISTELDIPPQIPVSNAFIDLSLFNDAPFYIKPTAMQMVQCYECGFYDAVLIIMRKLLETLIIETYEKFGIEQEIKDTNGFYLFLGDLIPKYLGSTKWNLSRNITQNITKIKKCGDLSAHNRRFLAKKSDIDGFKFELRQALQEMILIIGYHS